MERESPGPRILQLWSALACLFLLPKEDAMGEGLPTRNGSPVAFDQSLCLAQAGLGPPNLAYFWKPISLGMDRGRMKRKAVRLMVNLRSVYQGPPLAPSGSFAITAITAHRGRRECQARPGHSGPGPPALAGPKTSL